MPGSGIPTAGSGTEPLAALDGTGRRLIDEVHALLQIDEQWTEWHHDGFTWWAHGLAQRLRVEGPEDVDEIPTYWLSFETSVLKGLPIGHAKALTFVGLQNRVNNLFTARVIGDRLVYSGRAYALPESASDRARQLGHRSIIANALAHAQAEQLAEMYRRFEPAMAGVEVDGTAHPTEGERRVPDDMLNVIEQSYKRVGLVPVPMERVGDFELWASDFESRGLKARSHGNGTSRGQPPSARPPPGESRRRRLAPVLVVRDAGKALDPASRLCRQGGRTGRVRSAVKRSRVERKAAAGQPRFVGPRHAER